MKTRRIIKRCLGLLLLILAIPAIAPFVGFAWSPINCQHQDIDLKSGRARYTTMLYWIPISTRIRHTPISVALGISDLNSQDGDWQRVNTFSPGMSLSPHYAYHSALFQAKTLSLIWEMSRYSPEAKQEAASGVLRLWTESGGDSTVDDYLGRLANIESEEVDREDVVSLQNDDGESGPRD